jgi:hypothetical protein
MQMHERKVINGIIYQNFMAQVKNLNVAKNTVVFFLCFYLFFLDYF